MSDLQQNNTTVYCGIDVMSHSNHALRNDPETSGILIRRLFILHVVSYAEATEVLTQIRAERIEDYSAELSRQLSDPNLKKIYNQEVSLFKLNEWLKNYPNVSPAEMRQYFELNEGIEKLFGKRSISLQKLVNELKMFVKGQDEAIRTAAFVGYAHLVRNKLIELPAVYESEKLIRPVTLLIGPTGVGKTYLIETLCEQLNIDFFATSAANLVSSGYVGSSIEDIFTEAYLAFGSDTERLERSIIYIDEIDKISTRFKRGDNGDVRTEAIQIELLRLLNDDGCDFSFPATHDRYSRNKETINTANITWIFSGAFSGIEGIVARRTSKADMGFKRPGRPAQQSLDKIIKADLISYGLLPEFMGRIDNIVVMRNLTRNELMDILRYAEDGPLDRYLEFLKAHGCHVTLSDKFYNEVTELALALNTGARGLKEVLNEKLMSVMFNAAEHPDQFIEL